MCFLAECGIARVDTLEGLIEGFPLLARVPARPRGARPPAVAVVTTTAGGATMVVDPLARNGIAVRNPARTRLARLKAATGVDVAPARIVDLTLAGAQYKVMKGRNRRADGRARVRPDRHRGRIVGAVLSRSRGQADHR